jgi:hypothetical protein
MHRSIDKVIIGGEFDSFARYVRHHLRGPIEGAGDDQIIEGRDGPDETKKRVVESRWNLVAK